MPKKSLATIIALMIAGVFSPSRAQNVAVSKMALMTFTGTMEVKASPAQVWAALTDADKVQSWFAGWKSATAVKPLTTVGQTIAYVDEWSNAGKSIVLHAEKNKELRLAHMPNDGSYVCQVKFKLEPKGVMTTVTVVDQYSDNLDVPLDRDTAAKAKQTMMQYLAALKAVAEKPVSAK